MRRTVQFVSPQPIGGRLQIGWFESINQFARNTPVLHAPLRAYAVFGVVLFAALLLAAWWRARSVEDTRAMAAALWAPVGALVALAVVQPLNHAVAEARPYTVDPHALVLVAHTHDFSFPSDHSVIAGAVAMGVWLADRRLGWIAIAAALVMACARVYVGAHFPLDVVSGLLIGAVVVALGFAVLRRPLVRAVDLVARTPARQLVQASAGGGPAAG